jgi:hypothetical protein
VSEFRREPRYVVFKIKDVFDYLSDEQIAVIEQIGQRIAKGRAEAGKAPFNAVVVEQDWPEFEPTWSAIEARMTANVEVTGTAAALSPKGPRGPQG